jgi:cardiolipin synthase
LFDRLLRHGVEIYAAPPPMMHAKTAIVDERFVTIGSYNLDERSWRKNLEANVGVEDVPFALHVTEWFEHDLGRAERVDLAKWRARSFARRGVEMLALALRELW